MNVDGDVLIAKYWAEEGPIAELCIANHKHAGAEPHPFKVTFRDDGDLDFDSIDADDLRVVAPDGSLLPVELVDTNVRDHTRSTVTFSVAPPMGTWSADDNGIYAVRVLPESIADMDGHLNVGRDIGIFRVGIPI